MDLPVALRGYSRAPVDAALADLRTRLAEAEAARAAAVQRAEAAEAALQAQSRETDAEQRLRAEEAEQALVAVHEAAAREAAAAAATTARSTQPLVVERPALEDATTAVVAAVPGDPPSPHRGRLVAAATAAVVALVAVAVLLASREDDERSATAAPAAATPSASASPTVEPAPGGSGSAPQAARVSAELPDGWTTHRSPDGLWTIGLPPGWAARGDGFVSESGLTTMSVRTAGLPTAPDQRQAEEYERAFAAEHPGYRRLSAVTEPFRGHPAARWEYVHGSGEQQQRGSDLGVLVGDRGYWLHVESRASAWQFAEPLADGFRASFVPLAD